MLLLNHFTEKFDPVYCKGTCDNCASTDEVSEINLTAPATVFVKMIQELENRCMKITGAQSLHAFRGTSKADMVKRTFNTLEQFGKGSDISADLAKRLFDHLVVSEILMTELEEAQAKDRAPISYVYVSYTLFIICICHLLRLTRLLASSGPRQRSSLRTGHRSF
jgi:superfamily II DNA helicase RecQ